MNDHELAVKVHSSMYHQCQSRGYAKKPVIPLRFSKFGKEDIERQYATHFVDSARIARLKAERGKHNEETGEAENGKG